MRLGYQGWEEERSWTRQGKSGKEFRHLQPRCSKVIRVEMQSRSLGILRLLGTACNTLPGVGVLACQQHHLELATRVCCKL